MGDRAGPPQAKKNGFFQAKIREISKSLKTWTPPPGGGWGPRILAKKWDFRWILAKKVVFGGNPGGKVGFG